MGLQRVVATTVIALAVVGGGCSASRDRAATSAPAGHELRLGVIQTRESDRGLVFTIPDVLFEAGKADLRIDAQRELTAIAASLREHPQQKVSIEGHTDSTGTASANQELSLRRSTAVEAFFLKHGVDPERLEVRGVGEKRPVASNATVAGRQQNRRVEIVMLNGDGSTTSSAAAPSPRAPEDGRSIQ